MNRYQMYYRLQKEHISQIAVEKNTDNESAERIRIGKYTIIRTLGHGGEGRVYLARDEHLCRLVAVKCVRQSESGGEDPDGGEDFRQKESDRIRREAEYLHRLRHPMLPIVYDLFESEGHVWYLVMEYIQGITLKEYVGLNGRISEEQARVWAKQLAEALGYLHTRKPPVIYSDLKPENIMVCPEGRLRLVDFGAALTRSFGTGRNRPVAVTPGYGAPEQQGSIGRRPGDGYVGAGCYADERSDIYAFGKVLYYMVTGTDPGRPPYASRPVYEYQPLLGDGLEQMIRKCIRPEPERRYQTIEEVERELDRTAERRYLIRRKTFVRAIEKRVWLTEGEGNVTKTDMDIKIRT